MYNNGAAYQSVFFKLFNSYKFNTAIAAIMELVNELGRADDDDPMARAVRREGLVSVVGLLAPIVPHICTELWQQLGQAGDIVDAPWPVADTEALIRDEIELVVQVNGRKRALIAVPADADKDQCESLALADDNVARYTTDKTVNKVIVVPGKLVNIVVRE